MKPTRRDYLAICDAMDYQWDIYMLIASIGELLNDLGVGYNMAAEELMETNGCFIDLIDEKGIVVYQKKHVDNNCVVAGRVLLMTYRSNIDQDSIERIAQICATNDTSFW